jgi:hypothetical protein
VSGVAVELVAGDVMPATTMCEVRAARRRMGARAVARIFGPG